MRISRDLLLLAACLAFPVKHSGQESIRYLGKGLTEWVADLRSKDPKTYLDAQKAFEALGPKALPALPLLSQILDDKTASESVYRSDGWNVALVLSYMGPEAIPVAMVAARHPDRNIRLRGVGTIEDMIAKSIARYLASSPPDKSLVEPFRQTIPVLVEALGDSESLIRQAGLRAFAQLGQSGCGIPELIDTAANPKLPLWTRVYALKSLGAIGPGAIDALPTLRTLKTHSTEDSLIRGESNAALKKISGEEN